MQIWTDSGGKTGTLFFPACQAYGAVARKEGGPEESCNTMELWGPSLLLLNKWIKHVQVTSKKVFCFVF